MSDRHVLYVGTLFESGAAETYGIDDYSLAGEHKKRGVVRALRTVDVSVTVVSPVSISDGSVFATLGDRFHDDDLETDIHVPPSIGLGILEFALLTLTTLALTTVVALRERPDAVLFYNFKLQTAIPGAVSATLSRASLLVEYEDGMFVDPETVGIVRQIATTLRATVGRLLDGGICANTMLAETLPTANVAIIRGFPSIGMPAELPTPIASDSPVVMFSGRFDEVRGIDTFLAVAPLVTARTEDVTFWVAGYGDDEICNRIKRETEALDCDATYFGTLPWEEYRQRIVSADVLVNLQDPTLAVSRYTFPSKLLDYMSAGAMVVSTEVGDLNSTLAAELCLTTFNQDAIATAIATGLTDERLAAEYGARARRWVETNCSDKTVGAKIRDVINRASNVQ
jgi:glycosyltransferase involved in cell wall biosynthesis